MSRLHRERPHDRSHGVVLTGTLAPAMSNGAETTLAGLRNLRYQVSSTALARPCRTGGRVYVCTCKRLAVDEHLIGRQP